MNAAICLTRDRNGTCCTLNDIRNASRILSRLRKLQQEIVPNRKRVLNGILIIADIRTIIADRGLRLFNGVALRFDMIC